MNFEDFLKSLSKIKNIPLPAEASQYKMMPSYRKELIALQNENIKNAKQSAVLALFYPDVEYKTRIALILRKTYKGVHSAQIGFPGGKIEDVDTNLMDTALRETHEEIGVNPKHITVIKQMTQLYIPPSNYSVRPFIGYTDNTPNFILQEEEVQAILEVPVSDFIDDTKIVTTKVMTSYKNLIEVPAFEFNGYIVWGATAMMLSEVKDLLKAVL